MTAEFLNLRHNQSWMYAGLCSQPDEDPDDWFTPENTKTARDATAKCWQCPVRLTCLQHACDSNETDGILGGIPASERAALNHDFVWLSYHPNVYVRDRIKRGYSKFKASNLIEYRGPRE